jgi:hypothetical protein
MTLAALQARRSYECRLEPERALSSLEEAASWLEDRGLLTRTPDSSLPSLFEACREEALVDGGRGFAAWPRSKWSWPAELETHQGVTTLKIHRGKNLMLAPRTLAVVDPICRAELHRMSSADSGWQRLLDHLAATGPAMLDTIQDDLGLRPKELRALRSPLERCGAVVARQVVVRGDADDEGHRHSSVLARYDQVVPEPLSALEVRAAMKEAIVAGVEAAVVAPENELSRWFSWRWYFSDELVEELVDWGRLSRPAPGWIAAAET